MKSHETKLKRLVIGFVISTVLTVAFTFGGHYAYEYYLTGLRNVLIVLTGCFFMAAIFFFWFAISVIVESFME